MIIDAQKQLNSGCFWGVERILGIKKPANAGF
jgi:peptide methionine sulfoxide reductase MsrA